jgi:type IV secretion system protein VirD4
VQKTFDLNTIFAKIPKIIIIAIIVYILDVWLLTILSASIAEPSTITYYIFHPISTSLRYLLGFFYPDLVHNQSVFNTWKLINGGLILIGIGIFIYSSSNKITNHPVFKSDLLGSADWLKKNEIQPVFITKHSPGILFGLHQRMPVVLPPLADGNRNVAIWGPPGTRKSRAYIRNNLFQAVKSDWSVVVTDPKGELTRDFRKFFEKQGYTVRIFNLVNMAYSDRWNPLSEIKTDIDAQIFCEVVMANTTAPNKKGDQFWDRAETNLLKALVLYVIYEFPEKDRNMGSVCQIISSGSRDYGELYYGSCP